MPTNLVNLHCLGLGVRLPEPPREFSFLASDTAGTRGDAEPKQVFGVFVLWSAGREIHDQPARQSGDGGDTGHGFVLYGQSPWGRAVA